jgi:hypothetical protein
VAHGAVFTTVPFLHNLFIRQIVPGEPFQSCVLKHSRLVSPIVSYEKRNVVYVGHGTFFTNPHFLSLVHEWAQYESVRP